MLNITNECMDFFDDAEKYIYGSGDDDLIRAWDALMDAIVDERVRILLMENE